MLCDAGKETASRSRKAWNRTQFSIAAPTRWKPSAMGQMLRETEHGRRGAQGHPGGGTRGSNKAPRVSKLPTLSESGISKKESSICQKLSMTAQKLAELPDETFQAFQNSKYRTETGQTKNLVPLIML
ncbi:MAG: hypothetical protein O2960_18095 [Verrucomicrobia bacterium]|nr:hypothetical protein [Verrucomicrobiota bacterium]